MSRTADIAFISLQSILKDGNCREILILCSYVD